MKRGLLTITAGNPMDHIVQHPLLSKKADLGFLTPKGEVTVLSDHIVMLITAGLLLIVVLPILIRRRQGTDEIGRLVPLGFANFVEMVCQYLRKEVVEPNLGPYTDRFVKYLWSIFFFILTINLLGLLPIGVLMPWLANLHIGGTATANIWVTATLATLSLLMWVWNGLRLGGKHYLAHFSPGPIWLAPLLVPLEVIGVFAKAFSLAIRLFANMLAGHILLAVLVSFVLMAGSAFGTGAGLAIALPVVAAGVFITVLEILVAFLQAFIFTFLSTLFLGMSIVFHHGEEHEGLHAP